MAYSFLADEKYIPNKKIWAEAMYTFISSRATLSLIFCLMRPTSSISAEESGIKPLLTITLRGLKRVQDIHRLHKSIIKQTLPSTGVYSSREFSPSSQTISKTFTHLQHFVEDPNFEHSGFDKVVMNQLYVIRFAVHYLTYLASVEAYSCLSKKYQLA